MARETSKSVARIAGRILAAKIPEWDIGTFWHGPRNESQQGIGEVVQVSGCELNALAASCLAQHEAEATPRKPKAGKK